VRFQVARLVRLYLGANGRVENLPNGRKAKWAYSLNGDNRSPGVRKRSGEMVNHLEESS